MARYGIDVDGVLADFSDPYMTLLAETSGRDLWTAENRIPRMWSWDEHAGYSDKEISTAWRVIKKSPDFWLTCGAVPGMQEGIARLNLARMQGHEIYFITARPGITAKFQTEQWLMSHGMDCPTVIMQSDKAAMLVVLGLDAYIDDRLRNANLVMHTIRQTSSPARAYLQHAGYNDRPVSAEPGADQERLYREELRDPGLIVVGGIGEMLEQEGL